MRNLSPKQRNIMFYVAVTLALIYLFCSCTPGRKYEYDVVLKIGSAEYNVSFVTLSKSGQGIYVIYPKDSTLSVPLQTSFQNGKTQTTIVKLP